MTVPEVEAQPQDEAGPQDEAPSRRWFRRERHGRHESHRHVDTDDAPQQEVADLLDAEAVAEPTDDEEAAEVEADRGSLLHQLTRPTAWVPYLLFLIYLVPYNLLSQLRLYRHEPMSLDLALFEQAVKRYAHFQAPIVNLKGSGYNLLGDHFHPMLAVLAPVYRVFPYPQTLLACQAFLIALSIVPVTRAAIRITGLAAGTCVGLAYGLSFGLQTAVNFDFHEICIAVPLLAFSLEAFLRRRWIVCVLWAVPLIGVKEDLGLTVAALGVSLFLVRKRLLGLLVAIGGVLSFLLVIFVLIPALNPHHHYDYMSMANKPGTSWWTTIRDMFHGKPKLYTLLFVFGCVAFTVLLSPLAVMTLPTFGWRFVSQNTNDWGTAFHYDAVLMPIVFLGTLDVIARMRKARWGWVRAYATHLPAVLLVLSIMITNQFPFKAFIDPATYKTNVRQAAWQGALDAIPDGVMVESDQSLATYLVHRDDVYWIGDTAGKVPDYIVIDIDGNPSPPPDLGTYGESMHPGNKFGVVYMNYGYVVLHHVAN